MNMTVFKSLQQNELFDLCKSKTFLDIKSNVAKPFPKQQILHSSELKEFADNNFKFDKMAESCPNG